MYSNVHWKKQGLYFSVNNSGKRLMYLLIFKILFFFPTKFTKYAFMDHQQLFFLRIRIPELNDRSHLTQYLEIIDWLGMTCICSCYILSMSLTELFINVFGLNFNMTAFHWAWTSYKQANEEVSTFRTSWRTGLWMWRCRQSAHQRGWG